jgi:hypothetical protein
VGERSRKEQERAVSAEYKTSVVAVTRTSAPMRLSSPFHQICMLSRSNRHTLQSAVAVMAGPHGDSHMMLQVSSHLQLAMITNDKDQPTKRSADALEDDDESSVFLSEPTHVGFLKCKDHATHFKLSDFVERSIIRFLGEWLACLARKQLPSIQLVSNSECPEEDSALHWKMEHEKASAEHLGRKDESSWEDDEDVLQEEQTRGAKGRRRRLLTLAASNPEMSQDYARILKVMNLNIHVQVGSPALLTVLAYASRSCNSS